MGYRHDHDSLLAEAVAFVRAEGIGSLSFGRLAKRLGIADRTIVYYFPTKTQLVTEVMQAISLELLVQLQAAFGDEPREPDDLLDAAWPIVTDPASEPVFRVFIEASGLAVSGVEPYVSLIKELMAAWHDWLTPLIATSAEDPHDVAALVISQIEGLMMVRSTGLFGATRSIGGCLLFCVHRL